MNNHKLHVRKGDGAILCGEKEGVLHPIPAVRIERFENHRMKKCKHCIKILKSQGKI